MDKRKKQKTGRRNKNNRKTNMATHFMNLKPSPFNSIKAGKKDVEMRLYDDKRRLITPNDLIVFTNEESKETLVINISGLFSIGFPFFASQRYLFWGDKWQ